MRAMQKYIKNIEWRKLFMIPLISANVKKENMMFIVSTDFVFLDVQVEQCIKI